MPKVVVTDNLKDAALLASGRGLIVADASQSTQKIEVPGGVKKYSVEFLNSEIKHDEELSYEVARIKVKPIITMSNFFSSIRSDFSSGPRSNHYFKMPDMVDLASTHTEEYSTSKSQASYSFETIFNYISEEYDKLQVGISEYNLYAPFDRPSKQDFLDVQRRNTGVINFGRGSRMENFVVPTMKVQQGTEESPYYNYLRINQRLDNGISHFAVKLGIFDELLQDYLFGDRTDTSFDIQQGQSVSQDSTVPIYNLQSFLTTDRELDLDNFFTLNESIRSSRMSLGLRKHLMKGFLKDTSSTGFRTYRDIYNNLEAHKEVFCYSIDKHDGAVLDSTKIQTLYAPALDDSTPIVDTQVKYGKYYTYKITGHYMVVGNNYEYREISRSEDPEDEHVIVEVVNRPSVVIMPFHIFSQKINIVQMPPVYPQVSFKTKNNSSKSISMYLSPTKAEMKSPFIRITSDDDIQLRELDRLPNARDLNGDFRFKTYGDQGLFEVFRLDYAPKSFSDFSNAKIGEISMPFKSMDAIFEDVVIPNKKYYYLFRSINQKGLVSNPTSVYEATLLVDADDSEIITDTYHFPKPRDMESALGFRKLLRVTPAVEHILFDAAQDALFGKTTLVGTLDNLKLGIRDKAVWGRKFKIRIKSKTSGKMIDIILNVDLTKNKTEEEF